VISGALEIIFGVEAGLVHPLRLPASQGPERFGYIVITYEDSPDVYDILFVRGGGVEEYAGLHHELRTLLSEKSVRMGLAACDLRCRVYLFAVSRQGFDRFLRTFHCVPSVNVVIDRLSRKQLSSLLTGIGCKNGILEIDRPSHPFPLIDLTRFHSAGELLKEASRFRQGRMIVYDLDLNALIRQRVEIMVGDPPAGDGESPDEAPAEKSCAESGMTEDEESETPDPGAPLPESPAGNPRGGELVEALGNALKDFQQAVAGLYGSRMDKRMNHVLSTLFPPSGEFVPEMVAPADALRVLKVIEETVNRAWLYKRKKLRTKGLEIVRDLFENNTELLRKHGVQEKVQDCYTRLGE
jgi:hypothetical protein